jgi:hypothetical protein
MVVFNLPRGRQTSPKVIRLYARRRVQDILHQYFFLEYFGSPEGRYPAVLEEVVDSGPSIVGTALFQTGLNKIPDL